MFVLLFKHWDFMDFDKAIERNRDALMPIIAQLFAMLGLAAEASAPQRISRAIHTSVLRMLRPVESAVRRLIVVAAREYHLPPVVQRPFPAGGIAAAKPGERRVRPPAFALEDPRMPLMEPERRGSIAKFPRVISVFVTEPTIAGVAAARNVMPRLRPAISISDGQISSQSLINRLNAMRLALDDLPRQAKRLMRWTARRERLSAQRLVYTSPLRAGIPPYLNRKRDSEADRVLDRCHWMVHEVRSPKPQPPPSDSS